MSIQPRFGETIRALREKHKQQLTQREIATQAGITNVYLCQLEHGSCMPSLELVERLAGIFGKTVAELLA